MQSSAFWPSLVSVLTRITSGVACTCCFVPSNVRLSFSLSLSLRRLAPCLSQPECIEPLSSAFHQTIARHWNRGSFDCHHSLMAQDILSLRALFHFSAECTNDSTFPFSSLHLLLLQRIMLHYYSMLMPFAPSDNT